VSSLIKSHPARQSATLSLWLAGVLLNSLFFVCASAQTGSSSSSAPGATLSKEPTSRPSPRIAQPEAGGSAITLETSEPLFDVAVALNVCGYDADLSGSSPVRLKIRDELNSDVAGSAAARASRDALCGYVREHTLTDSSLNLAQYISLALYLTPPPELTPTVGETELPPDSTQVVNILPLLRTFATDVNLHEIWIEHRPEYEALLARVHDPITKMILNTNIYLGMPVSSYDGRRFLVLLEPMLAPSATNARIYSSDYIVVASPAGDPLGAVHLNDIRHIYLHYEVEPLVYARASAMDRLQPLLKAVQDAPLEFTYKSEIVPLITECLIKAVEARTMDVGIAKPLRPAAVKERADLERYDAEMTVYDREAEAVRRKAVDLDMRQGWILAAYFYDQVGQMGRESISLKEDMGQMVYGMDVEREQHAARQIAFLPQGSGDVLSRGPRQLAGLQLAEMKIFKGDLAGASEIANKALSDPNGDHPQAHYVLARVDLMQRQPGAAIGDFQQVIDTSKDPRTLAWSHIYLGRLYDVNQERQKALAEYQAALKVRDAQPDTKAAAETGLKQPFTAPAVEHQTAPSDSDDAPLDPSGKAEKEAYRPPPPPQ
jgi:predicted negative regulator of RcsB-dependent stress response